MAARCDQVGWFSFLTYGWTTPLVVAGIERQVHLDDTPGLAKAEDTAANAHRLLTNLAAVEANRGSHPLLRAVVATFWTSFACLEVLKIAQHFLGLLNPLLLKQLLIFSEDQEKHTKAEIPPSEVSAGIWAVVALLLLHAFGIVFGSQLEFYRIRVHLRIGSALRGTVLHRCVKGLPAGVVAAPTSQAAHTNQAAQTNNDETEQAQEKTHTPTVYNVLSFDVPPSLDIIWIVLDAWLFPVQFVSVMIVLYGQVQMAVIPGLITVLIAKTICGVLLVCDGYVRDLQLSAKDERLGRCQEGFTHIRTLQMLAWTPAFLRRMMQARSTELSRQRQRLWLQKSVAALDYSLGPITTLATLGYFVLHDGNQLKASVAIPVFALVQQLVGPFGQFPVWANQYLVWRSAYDRVSNYIGLNTLDLPGPPFVEAAPLPWSPRGQPPAPAAVAAYSRCSLAWSPTGAGEADAETPLLAEPSAFTLQELDMQVMRGDLCVICGTPGQGKSSLLQGLLGELSVEEGSAKSPAIVRRSAEDGRGAGSVLLPTTMAQAQGCLEEAAGRGGVAVAYAAQSVALFSGTVRDNILFRCRYDRKVYKQVLQACALVVDLEAMHAGDMTEVAQGGATLSGGQKARVGLARAVYRATLDFLDKPGETPLVLIDDPFCALDKSAAREICHGLFGRPTSLLARCAVVVTAADPWWLTCLGAWHGEEQGMNLRVGVMRAGRLSPLASADIARRSGFAELEGLVRDDSDRDGSPRDGGPGPARHQFLGGENDAAPGQAAGGTWNPQDGEVTKQPMIYTSKVSIGAEVPMTSKLSADTDIDEDKLVKQEHREEGGVQNKTYIAYLMAVGPGMLAAICVALTGIMAFQSFCDLWVAYWTAEDKAAVFREHPTLYVVFGTPPTRARDMWWIYAGLVFAFTICNFAGHGLEIVGGIRASRQIFSEALEGTLSKPFRWWDANPTGRVLNRFSEDVEVMDKAVTNILGVIFGAVLYFVGRLTVLTIASPRSLMLLPMVIALMEYYAKYYRMTIRELQRIFLISMSSVYSDMSEAILGKVTIRAFGSSRVVICSNLAGLDELQRAAFAKDSVCQWIKFRMSVIGFGLNAYATLQPLLQFFGYLQPQSAALVGFSIKYTSEIIGIIQQVVMNYSDLEMQLISIERLREYADGLDGEDLQVASPDSVGKGLLFGKLGPLRLCNVEVTYREGLPAALKGVTIDFRDGEVTAIMGRTGAGKSSLLLSVLQLVPYRGTMAIAGRNLACMDPHGVRQHLVGVVPQAPVIFEGSLRENLDPERRYADMELWTVLKAVGLQNLLAHGLDSPLGRALSQGQQQLLCAARVLLRKPQVVLLDEVTASLPSDVAKETLTTLLHIFRESMAVTLLVTHQEELVEFCDRVVTVSAGRIVNDERVA